MNVAIVVLNYNGKHLLARFLPSILRAAGKCPYQCKVIVLDNLSEDDSVDFLKKEFSGVKIAIARSNDVLCSYNELLNQLQSQVVILLNNDIRVDENFISPLVQRFIEEKKVFFVAPKILNPDSTFNGGKSFLELKLGIIQNVVDRTGCAKPGITHSIATGAFNREIFLKIGGFDKLFLPGIWEEVDLCYQGLLRGYRGLYEPSSVIWHDESSTFNKVFGPRGKNILAYRNMFFFTWKNIFDIKIMFQHIFFLPAWLIYSIFCGKQELFLGFIQALRHLKSILKQRKACRLAFSERVLRDKDIIGSVL